ncbi:MAG: hypothetical protein IPK33_13640 [Gemmatimonadetes bacterium]|nr:hypothetical protein [Gemmatimonadota bacterium]
MREVSHSGSTAGYCTLLARYPEAKASVAVWCNAAPANAVQLGREVAALVVPRTAPARGAPAPIAAAERGLIVGPYRDPRTDDWLSISSVGEYARVIGPSADSLRSDGAPGRYIAGTGDEADLHAGRCQAAAPHRVPDGDVTEMVASPPLAAAVALGDYAGTFRSPELDSRIVIRLDGANLRARISTDDELALIPFYADGFRVGGATLRFVRDAGGKVTGLRAFAGRARNVRFDREG